MLDFRLSGEELQIRDTIGPFIAKEVTPPEEGIQRNEHAGPAGLDRKIIKCHNKVGAFGV